MYCNVFYTFFLNSSPPPFFIIEEKKLNMDEVKSLLGSNNEEGKSDFEISNICPSLSYKQVCKLFQLLQNDSLFIIYKREYGDSQYALDLDLY